MSGKRRKRLMELLAETREIIEELETSDVRAVQEARATTDDDLTVRAAEDYLFAHDDPWVPRCYARIRDEHLAREARAAAQRALRYPARSSAEIAKAWETVGYANLTLRREVMAIELARLAESFEAKAQSVRLPLVGWWYRRHAAKLRREEAELR